MPCLLDIIRGTLGAHTYRHGRFNRYRDYTGIFCSEPALRPGVRKTMSTWEMVMGIVMAVGLSAYLVYAMLRPEKF